MKNMRCFITLLLSIGLVHGASIEQIWLAPSNPNVNETNFLEPFNLAARGEWFTSEDGVGARYSGAVVMDSHKTVWILGGAQRYGVWNYNPNTDKYRWVWKVSNDTDTYYPGELDVESELNSPGGLSGAPTTIDLNDNIWIYYQMEVWMFNTSSWMWVRKQGLYNETFSSVSFGSDPGKPGTDVWPGTAYSNMLTDSHGDLWLLGGITLPNLKLTNNVWHYNTTSNMWRFVSGDTLTDPAPSNTTYFGGFYYAACDIDEEDKIWCYGGSDSFFPITRPSTLWMYDTRANTWTQKFNAGGSLPHVTVEDAFDAGNSPGGSISGNFINRRDGTFLLVPGVGFNSSGDSGGVTDVWLYNITFNQWKHVLGDLTSIYSNGTYITRGQPGSTRPGTIYFGIQSGLNFEGDVFLHGGILNNFFYFKDIWLIPNDQCLIPSLNKCDTNAECIEKLVSYSCQCNQGYEGDGFKCTLISVSQAPKSATSNVTRLIASVSWFFVAVATLVA